MANHPNRRNGYMRPRVYCVAYRCRHTGSVVTAEYSTRRERDERLAALAADADGVEWARKIDDPIASTSSYGR